MEGKKILIADDSRELTGLYSALFKGLGFDVAVANNGSECLRMVKTVRPNLIILDVQMPDMDGCEVLEFLHQDEATMNIPVIILSGTVIPSNSEMRIHGVIYLSKLADFDEIIACVKEELSKQPGMVRSIYSDRAKGVQLPY